MTVSINVSERHGYGMDITINTSRDKHICVGILAHVDAGKTTLSEALLYTAGALSLIHI